MALQLQYSPLSGIVSSCPRSWVKSWLFSKRSKLGRREQGMGDRDVRKSFDDGDFRGFGRRVLKNQIGNGFRFRLGLGAWVLAADPVRSCEVASSGGEFEVVSDETPPFSELCEHSESRVADSCDSRVTLYPRVLTRLLFLGDNWKRSCPQSQGNWRKFSAALLCSCALVTPTLASPVPAVEALPASDFVAAAVTLAGALGILQFFDELAKRDLLEKKLSRKLCHILSGMVFMLLWPLFSSAPLAKYLAAFAPAANGIRMVGLGLGLWKNEALVKAISREGSQRELLQGPLYYAITITVATLFFWRNSPVGACAVATLCAGDGFADIVGRKYGTQKLPYNSGKSYIGSVVFFVMAALASMGYVAYFSGFGFFTATSKMYLAAVGVALASAIVESLPLPLDDNFTVPFTAIGVGMLLLPS